MTLAEFYKRVAQRLGVLPVGQDLGPDDADVIGNAYIALMHELLEHGLAYWNADEDVPDLYADVMIGMVSAAVVDEFVIAEPRRSQLIGQHGFGLPLASVSERRLRSLLRAGASDTAVVEYY